MLAMSHGLILDGQRVELLAMHAVDIPGLAGAEQLQTM